MINLHPLDILNINYSYTFWGREEEGKQTKL